ncbi:unnamed protein product [Prorocentrum cordatum]|uniref:Uncharacterized protein n=1 Tax=Prorocentrum cordatum TaxID=2364126 RepID=A0ABN9RIC4_9DINO|nr:unnamed protein product [Polarella glacialis]
MADIFFSVDNLDHTRLENDASLAGRFREEISRTLASRAISPERISVRRVGDASLQRQAAQLAHDQALAARLGHESADGLATLLRERLLRERLASLEGIQNHCSGPISVSGVKVSAKGVGGPGRPAAPSSASAALAATLARADPRGEPGSSRHDALRGSADAQTPGRRPQGERVRSVPRPGDRVAAGHEDGEGQQHRGVASGGGVRGHAGVAGAGERRSDGHVDAGREEGEGQQHRGVSSSGGVSGPSYAYQHAGFAGAGEPRSDGHVDAGREDREGQQHNQVAAGGGASGPSYSYQHAGFAGAGEQRSDGRVDAGHEDREGQQHNQVAAGGGASGPSYAYQHAGFTGAGEQRPDGRVDAGHEDREGQQHNQVAAGGGARGPSYAYQHAQA